MNAEPCLDVATLEKLTQIGGKEFATEMINLFLSYVPKKLAEARAAGQTGDRLGPVRCGTWRRASNSSRVNNTASPWAPS